MVIETRACVAEKIGARLEIGESTSEKESEAQRSKPLAVPSDQGRPGDQVGLRVAEVLSIQLARGSMPT